MRLPKTDCKFVIYIKKKYVDWKKKHVINESSPERISDLDSAKKNWIVSYQSGKFRADNSECNAITVTEKRLKTSKMNLFCFLFNEVNFDEQNSNPMSIFVGIDRKTSTLI